MKNKQIHLCSFTSLEGLKKNCSDGDLIRALKASHRFSIWEEDWLLNRITRLEKSGLIKTSSDSMPFPWIQIL